MRTPCGRRCAKSASFTAGSDRPSAEFEQVYSGWRREQISETFGLTTDSEIMKKEGGLKTRVMRLVVGARSKPGHTTSEARQSDVARPAYLLPRVDPADVTDGKRAGFSRPVTVLAREGQRPQPRSSPSSWPPANSIDITAIGRLVIVSIDDIESGKPTFLGLVPDFFSSGIDKRAAVKASDGLAQYRPTGQGWQSSC